MKSLLTLAIATVRAWTRLYTWRMEPGLRRTRVAEIESDLWEFQQDQAERGTLALGAHVLLRLVNGIPDDLSWRVEHDDFGDRLLRRTVALAGMAVLAAIFVTTLWAIAVAMPDKLPEAPQPTRRVIVIFAPASLPPPPPAGRLVIVRPPTERAGVAEFEAGLEELRRQLDSR